MTGSTILVIDDDAIVRESIVAYLKGSGFNTHEAENGQQGLHIFRQCQPDLILCDLRMPVMDGLTMLSLVRSEASDIPFIVVSGAGVMTDVVEALHLGASDFLVKPIVDLEVLEYAINRALEKAQLLMENKRYRASLEEAINSLKSSLTLLQEDQKAGRQVQMNMFPRHPLEYQDFKVDHSIIPSLYLSGDFVDYFTLSDHSFAFYLADVSGHGASSAFVTVLLKHMSISLLQDYHDNGGKIRVKPSHVLSYINQSLLKTGLGKHVTVFGGIVNTRDQTLTYSFGGHFPLPVIAEPGKKVHFLEGKGLPVGLFEDAVYEDAIIDLPRQFSLTILSDGILEVLPQKSLKEKEDYLLSVIAEGADTIDILTERLGLNDIQEAPDDIAMLILARY
ncbi:SpoIIE family protein phosphatase [Endozoicomonas sp. SCSIO W0465]|uniref:SpoIIE family protein phosphatase n=1 Tax=Endozoicomonas sp. SCSIO W0465 TaxID=2918516 RepID=UPI0020757AC9|nr:SpoIIE family protein phosphatase [Endozoicomonas sp. SCSIO W0465]USE39553.1 SpoIIE family protein phosphatase [Endozoicomonas sp. SCSIO W0465]